MTRLFVPLSSQPFFNFRDNGKRFELREYKRQWTEKNVYSGRYVELRRGYSTYDSLFGVIGKVYVGNILEILEKVDFRLISPLMKTKQEFLESHTFSQYIAFEIVFD